MKKILNTCFVIIVGLHLSGCGESAWSNAKSLLEESKFFKKITGSYVEEPVIKRETVSNIPYASISAGWGKQDPALLILGYVDKGDYLQWVASNNVSIVTKYGRIVKTSGLLKDVKETFFEGTDPLEKDPHLISESIKHNRIILFGGEEPEQISIQCEMVRVGPERITIVELEFETIRLEEKCKGVKWWPIKNTFWVDFENGMVWKSQQDLVDNQPKMELNTLKPFISQ